MSNDNSDEPLMYMLDAIDRIATEMHEEDKREGGLPDLSLEYKADLLSELLFAFWGQLDATHRFHAIKSAAFLIERDPKALEHTSELVSAESASARAYLRETLLNRLKGVRR